MSVDDRFDSGPGHKTNFNFESEAISMTTYRHRHHGHIAMVTYMRSDPQCPFWASCSCGWQSSNYPTGDAAQHQAEQHLVRITR